VADTGNPAAGTSTVTADMTALNGQSAVALTTTGGPFTVDGTTYNYRSAQLTASLASGNSAINYNMTALDLATNSRVVPFPAWIDNTVPGTTDVQITNGTGTAGRADRNDVVTLGYTEPLDSYTVIPATSWNGTTPTNVVVRLLDGGGGNDTLQVWNAANTTQVSVGSINLGSKNYNTTGATINFGATGTASSMLQTGITPLQSSQIAITLGTASATAQTVAGTTTMIWTPSATALDPAGNAMSTTTRTEGAPGDPEF
jgi:hypothetical protein